jgi:maltose alpha-D-glucosyltransferase/alpha-amylase
MAAIKKKKGEILLDDNPGWYKDAIIYQLHVRAFCDANGDGIGDFEGLTTKLDYLQDLGVTAIWLLPFYPSPLKDDGYDIADYRDVHPNYGTIHDFRVFLNEAHRRGLRVITELVINHTSDQHAWFRRAREAKHNSSARNFYVWNDTPEKYQDARVIFKDFEPSNWAWDPVAKTYYWHRFYSHQPDLNFDNPEVRKALLHVLDFWLEMGVDGLRLDAVPYLYEREGTSCENLAETHAFLKELRKHVDAKYKNRMLLAEANQWPEDAVTYFGEGDECHMAFHFPVMPRLFMGIHMEDRYPIIDILDQTPQIPDTCQWATFLRNHDELTLEMVTDEDRDYMYNVYANDPQARINLGIRRRLAPLLRGHRRKMELMNSLLFALPGSPVIYYGDEIGMGDNIYLGDRNGVRSPMQWSADRNAGFSRANSQRLYSPIIIDPEYHCEAINVEVEQQNQHSLLWWMKRLLVLRKRFHSFGRGSIEFLTPENRKILSFIRRFEDEAVLVVANLSRFVQFAELDLSAYKDWVPVEMFGHMDFPPIGELPYLITFGPHAFYWFKLEPPRVVEERADAIEAELPAFEVPDSWDGIFHGRARAVLEKMLPDYLKKCRWFGGKARPMRLLKLMETIPVSFDSSKTFLTALEVQYGGGTPESYFLPLTFASGERATEVIQNSPKAVVCRIRVKGKGEDSEGIVYDALYDEDFCKFLLDAVSRRRRFKGESGELLALPSKVFRKVLGSQEAPLNPSVSKAEQSNTSVIYGDRLILKIFRRIQEGVNPDLEIGRFITEKTTFTHIPPLAGAFEYRRGRGGPISVGVLQGLVPNEGDAWSYTLDSLAQYFEAVLARQLAEVEGLTPDDHLLDLVEREIPPVAQEVIGSYLESARLLGQRTGELHVALASDPKDPEFSPEPFTAFNRRSLYQSMRTLADQSLNLLNNRLKAVPPEVRPEAEKILGLEKEIFKRFQSLVDKRISGMRIRCHGDYHLGQVLYTGKDFVIIDFEGEPARPISQRRLKGSPLRDVAGMLRSFHYAAISKLKSGRLRPEDIPNLETWARLWHLWVSGAFLKAYFEAASQAEFLPKSKEELKVLLDLHLLEKAAYELAYELNNRPDWVGVPIQGILELVQPAP